MGRIIQPLEHEDMSEFVAALGPINEIAESTPGFVWRLEDEAGASSSFVEIPGNDDPLLIINYSIWEDIESLRHFMFKSGHMAYLRRRSEWFEKLDRPTSVAWWIPAGAIPHVGVAFQKVIDLQENGPTESAFTINRPWPAPE